MSTRKFICEKSGTIQKKEPIKNPAVVASDQIQAIPDRQLGNQVGAASKIETTSCPFGGDKKITTFGCLVWRAPYMSATFLFRPLPLIDTTSTVSTIASSENVLWILAFLFLVYKVAIKRKFVFFEELVAPLIFCVLYIVGAGSYEGNMGTAFRHKSLILWILLLAIFAVTYRDEESRT